MQAKHGARDDAECAERAGHQFGQVIARYILHHFAAAGGQSAVGQRNGDADDQVPQRTKAEPESAGVVSRKNASHSRRFRPEHVNGEPLVMDGKSCLQAGDCHSGFDRYGQVRPGVLDDLIEAAGGEDHIRALRRMTPAQLGASAARDNGKAGAIRLPQGCCQLNFAGGFKDKMWLLPGHGIPRRGGANAFIAEQGVPVGFARMGRGEHAHGFGWIHYTEKAARESARLETLGGARKLGGMRYVFAGLFPAEARGGKDFSGICELQRIESAANALHGSEIRFREHFGHIAFFVFANAVLASDRASRRDAQIENAGRERVGGLFLAWDAAVVEHKGVQIAVSRVKYIGDAQTRLLAEPRNLREHFRQRRPRDHAVLHNIVPRNAAHGGEGSLASLPKERALKFRLRQADFRGAMRAADLVNVPHQELDFRERAVEFHEQQPAADWIIRVYHGLGSLDRQWVHHLDGCRKHPRGDDAADGSTGFVGGRKGREEDAHALRTLDQPENHFRRDAERAFRADKNPAEVATGSIEGLAANTNQFTIRQDYLEAENGRRREAILKAVGAAGIFRYVAANGTDRLRGRVWGVEIFLRGDTVRHFQIDDSGLDYGARVGHVDFEYAVHPRKGDDDAAFDRQCAAAQPCAGAARHKGDLLAMANSHDALHFLRGGRQDHCAGLRAEVRERVAFVCAEFLGSGDNSARPHDRAKFVKDGGREWHFSSRLGLLPHLSIANSRDEKRSGSRIKPSRSGAAVCLRSMEGSGSNGHRHA